VELEALARPRGSGYILGVNRCAEQQGGGMGKQLIEQIEKKLVQSEGLDAGVRHELLGMLGALKAEMDAVGGERAESIAGFAGAATHEATRSQRNPDLLQHAVAGLADSVKEIEVEHPKVVEIVNGICTMLSNLGI
jgi:hypothetical protein